MKRLILAGAALLTLAACTSNAPSVTYDLTFRIADESLRQELVAESMRVIERRLSLMGEELLDKKVTNGSGSTSITIRAEHKEALDALTEDLAAPFTFAIMHEVSGSGADITVEGHGGFAYSGIGNNELEWVQSRQQPGSEKGEVRMVFTEAGRTKMADLFKMMNGKSIGVFVRERLVSKLLVETDELKDDIVIQDIPDPELAQVFADDVNVGINVTFTPVP